MAETFVKPPGMPGRPERLNWDTVEGKALFRAVQERVKANILSQADAIREVADLAKIPFKTLYAGWYRWKSPARKSETAAKHSVRAPAKTAVASFTTTPVDQEGTVLIVAPTPNGPRVFIGREIEIKLR